MADFFFRFIIEAQNLVRCGNSSFLHYEIVKTSRKKNDLLFTRETDIRTPMTQRYLSVQ